MTGLIASSSAASTNNIGYALSDIRILYLFDRHDLVDWPVLYYLNHRFGARIDLVSLHARPGFRYLKHEVENQQIFWHEFLLGDTDSNLVDSALTRLFSVRRPDVVILGEISTSNSLYNQLASSLSNLPADSSDLFDVLRVYSAADGAEIGALSRSVTLNREELWQRYEARIRLELPELSERFVPNRSLVGRLAKYTLSRDASRGMPLTPDFLSGIDPLRLEAATTSIAGQGSIGQALGRRARSFESLLMLASRMQSRQRAEKLIDGYKELLELDYELDALLQDGVSAEFRSYVKRLLGRTQRAVLSEIGLDWEGKIILRDSPHGPKLKFRASLSANGANSLELSYVRFLPYWIDTAMILDSVSRIIQPHQMFVREYGVDVGSRYLEAEMPESLLFAAEIVYGRIPLTVRTAIPIWESPDIDVQFEPGFTFVPPVARLDVDRVASSLNWKVVVTKPLYYYGEAKIFLETPRGVFAGAYRQTIRLDKGRTTETIRIPFSVSNLFEPGPQRQIISLEINDRVVAADTGKIRIAETRIADTVTIGFMPDSLGYLEDILRMADAAHRPLTDRSLQTGDIDAYDVIVVGSGALADYPSFRSIRGRLEDFVRYGGSLVVLGQPESWPNEVLPVSFVPSIELLSGSDLLNRIPEARILSRPYKISEGVLFQMLDKARPLAAAVISPAEKVYVTPSGATLLSISRLGDGQLIFCGLPLMNMVSELNIEAIHLLSNILTY